MRVFDSATKAFWADLDKLAKELEKITGRRMDECQYAAGLFDQALRYYDPNALEAHRARTIPGHKAVLWGGLFEGPTIKDQRRQLMRLTRANPRQDALSALSPQAEFHLERGLLDRGEWTEDWRSRPLSTLRAAAMRAIEVLPRYASPRGRPKDEFGRRYIATCAHIAEEVLSVRPGYGPLSRFVRILVAIGEHYRLSDDRGLIGSSPSRNVQAALIAWWAGEIEPSVLIARPVDIKSR